jgi:hypothetical protein
MPERLDYLRDRLRTWAMILKHASWEISYKLRLYATENFNGLPGIFNSMDYVAVAITAPDLPRPSITNSTKPASRSPLDGSRNGLGRRRARRVGNLFGFGRACSKSHT